MGKVSWARWLELSIVLAPAVMFVVARCKQARLSPLLPLVGLGVGVLATVLRD